MINISERLNKFIRPLGFVGFFLDIAGAIIGIFIFKTADYNNPLVIIIPASLIFNVLYFIFFKDSGEIEIFDDFERIFFLLPYLFLLLSFISVSLNFSIAVVLYCEEFIDILRNILTL